MNSITSTTAHSLPAFTAGEPDPLAHLALEAGTLADIQAVVRTQPWRVCLPQMLKDALRLTREQQFARLAVIGMPLLLLLMVADLAVGIIIYGRDLTGTDKVTWYQHMSVCGITLVTAFAMTRPRPLRPSYLWWASALSGVVIFHKLYMSMALQGPRLAQCGLDMTVMMLIIVMLAMRLTVTAATVSCLASGTLALGLAMQDGLHPDYLHVVTVYFGTFAVTFFVAILLNRQEQLNFLQAVLLSHDAREMARLNRELAHLSKTDALSGLANRRHFDEVLAREWERAQREASSIAIVFVDVDHFKAYNDSYGHLAGDDCLSRVGEALGRALMRPADLAARYGGEEFVILLPGTDHKGALEVAERALTAVDALGIPHRDSSVGPQVTISIGMAALTPGGSNSPAELVDAADTALYKAKRTGRHRIVVAPGAGTAAEHVAPA